MRDPKEKQMNLLSIETTEVRPKHKEEEKWRNKVEGKERVMESHCKKPTYIAMILCIATKGVWLNFQAFCHFPPQSQKAYHVGFPHLHLFLLQSNSCVIYSISTINVMFYNFCKNTNFCNVVEGS